MITIKTNNVIKKFNSVYALQGLSIEIKKGKITGMAGPNGSGKTTLINVLSGMTDFDSGEIIIGNKKYSKLSPLDAKANKLSRTFQGTRLFEQMTVFDNLIAVFTKHNVFTSIFQKYQKSEIEKVEKILKKVGLYEKMNDLVINLSYGQRKLVEISRAVLTDAEIILFDEPFAGLLPEMIKTVKNIIRELKNQNKTIILIEHDMEIIKEIADSIIVLDSGKLLSKGKPNTTLKDGKVIDAYLGK